MKKEHIGCLLAAAGMVICAHGAISYSVDREGSIGAANCGQPGNEKTLCKKGPVPNSPCDDHREGATSLYCAGESSKEHNSGKSEAGYYRIEVTGNCRGGNLTCVKKKGSSAQYWHNPGIAENPSECGIFSKYSGTGSGAEDCMDDKA